MRAALLGLLLLFSSSALFAQEGALPPGSKSPLLRLETGGPRSYISGVLFSPDGQRLYAGGWDKAVLVWERDAKGTFEYRPDATFRVPTGSGNYGGLNAIALTDDGQWLAAAGQSHARDMSDERSTGFILPAGLLSEESILDEGMIYVFNTKTRAVTLLRGHRGPIQSMTFAKGAGSPVLVSVAEERVSAGSELVPRGRAWDVAKGTTIAELKQVPSGKPGQPVPLPQLQGFRPGLAAWRTGTKTEQVRVALGLGDSQLRLWDPAEGLIVAGPTSPNLLTILGLPGENVRLLTGGHADVGVWSLPGGRGGPLPALGSDLYRKLQVASVNGQQNNLVSTAALVPAVGGRPARIALIVTKYLPDGRGEYRLVLTEASSPYATVRELPLPWTGAIRQPSIAVSADGRLAAFFGGSGNEIAVYDVAQLGAGNLAEPQILRSAGIPLKAAEFVRRGEEWGLRLTPETDGATPLILDIANRGVSAAGDGWQAAAADATGWSVTPEEGNQLAVKGPEGVAFRFPIPAGSLVSAAAVCPKSPACSVPLVAVATHQNGQPRLQILRGDTGEETRWCVGHTERIRSLSFSADGRMLVSAAADRSVAVWTVANLEKKVLGVYGRIVGLEVHNEAEKVVVGAAPASLPLKKGDVIVSVRTDLGDFPAASAKEFYGNVQEQKPGTNVEVTITRGGQRQTIRCPVGQAIDESKPLFTLFVAPGNRADRWQWIGWHPLGNFDAIGADVDRWLGWHFNTGEKTEPARFAAIGEYRDAFFRRNLLKSLIDAQDLVAPAVQENPKVSIRLRRRDGQAVEVDVEGASQLKNGDVDLVATVSGVTVRRIRRMEGVLDDGTAIPLVQEAADTWSADLSKGKWSRGRHVVSLRLATPDREVVQTHPAEFIPTPPSLELALPGEGEIDSETYGLKARALPSTEPLHVQLLVRQAGESEKKSVKTWDTRETLSVDQPIALLPGENLVELVAWNASAPDNVRERETVRRTFFIRRAIPPMAPRIEVTEVETVPYDGAPAPLRLHETVYDTAQRRVRIKGTVRGMMPINAATLVAGGEERKLPNLDPGQSKEFTFEEVVELAPGSQSVVLRADVKGKVDEKRLTLRYALPPPRVENFTTTVRSLQDLPDGMTAAEDVLIAGYDDQIVLATAVLQGPMEHPYRITFRLNDRELPAEQVTFDRAEPGEHRVSIPMTLDGGRNMLSVRVENEWSAEAQGASLMREYRRPPQVLSIDGPEQLVGEPLAVTAKIRSEGQLREAWLVIDGTNEVRQLPIAQEAGDPKVWELKSGPIGIMEGEHVVRVHARNDEGVALVPVEHRFVSKKPPEPPPAPPALAIVNPIERVDTARFALQYTVKSKVPAELRYELRANGNRGQFEEGVLMADQLVVDGSVQTLPLELFEGSNEIVLTTRNSGGFGEKRRMVVSYTPPPVSFELASIGGVPLQGMRAVKGVPQSRAELVGSVRVRNFDPAKEQLFARVWVNSYLFPTVPIRIDGAAPKGKADDAEGFKFRTSILLSDPRNRIRIEFFRMNGPLATEVSSSLDYVAETERFETEQNLYLVLLGSSNPGELKSRARAALQVVSGSQGDQTEELWESKAFRKIFVFTAPNNSPKAMQNTIVSAVWQMPKGENARSNAVLMIYYHGEIHAIENEGDFVLGGIDPKRSLSSHLTGQILQTLLLQGYGAHVIFLDLDRGGLPRTPDIWPRAPHLGIAVSKWDGPGKQPPESQFLSALEHSLPKTQRMGELARQIDLRELVTQKTYPTQIEMLQFLDSVSDLRIGAQ